MNKRPTLILQPLHNSSADILKCFALGKPLNSDQMHYLEWYQHQLSSREFDPVLQYYIHSTRRHHYRTSFLLPSEELNFESIQKLKKRLQLFLRQKSARAVIGLTEKQFLKFKQLNMNELIFWHGNQTLTSAPMFPGGIPPVIYFQWGNFFGVVKYVVLAEEKALKANLLVYFEDMQERNLNQCVLDYEHSLKTDLELQKNILYEHNLEPEPFDRFLIKTPTLSIR